MFCVRGLFGLRKIHNMFLCVDFAVRVSNACHAEANGLYTCCGIHNGKPAYRRDVGIMVLWICYADAWCLVQNCEGVQKVRYSCTFNSAHTGRDHVKLPVGQWLGPNGEMLCHVTNEYKNTVRMFSGYHISS